MKERKEGTKEGNMHTHIACTHTHTCMCIHAWTYTPPPAMPPPPFRAGPRWAAGARPSYSRQGCCISKYLVSKDIRAQNDESVGTFHFKIFSQQGYPSTKFSVSRDIPVQNVQSVGTFQRSVSEDFKYKMFSQWDSPVQNIPTDGTFQWTIFLPTEYCSLEYSYRLNIVHWNVPSVGIFQWTIFSR